MVGKLTGVSQITATASVTSKKKKQAKRGETKTSHQTSLTEQIVKNIDFSAIGSDAELRRKLIFETLAEAFGHDMASSPKFKKLIEDINDSFSENKHIQTQVAALKRDKNLKF